MASLQADKCCVCSSWYKSIKYSFYSFKKMCQSAGYDIFDLEKYCPWKEVAPFWEAAQTASNQPTAKSIEKQQAAEVDTHIDTPPHASLSINLFHISSMQWLRLAMMT